MLPTKANSSESNANPQTQYQKFLSAFNHGNLSERFNPDRPPILAEGKITFFLKAQAAACPQIIGHLEAPTLAAKVLQAVRHSWGSDAPGRVAYASEEASRPEPRTPQDANASTGINEPEENWFKFPLLFINDLPQMTPAELKILIYIIRHTWGYHQSEREISVTEFQHGRRATRKSACQCAECKKKGLSRLDHGTGMTEKSIRNGLKKALEHGYLNVRIDDSDRGRMKKFYSLRIK